MKRLFKKNVLFSVALLFLVGLSMTNVSASMSGFSGSAGYDYEYVSSMKEKTTSTATKVKVKWTHSDTSCNMWFKCVNDVDETRGKSLLTGTSETTKYLSDSSTTKGYHYRLMTSREHILNPTNYVSGTWEP